MPATTVPIDDSPTVGRNPRRLRRAGAALAVAVSTFAIPTGIGAGAVEAEPTIAISPSSGPVGTVVHIAGSVTPGFCTHDVFAEIGENWQLNQGADGKLHSALVGTTQAENDWWAISGTIPDTIESIGAIPDGEYGIHVHCYNFDLSANPFHLASTTFTVDSTAGPEEPGGPDARASMSLDVTSVAPGGSVSVSATGFAPDSEVRVELHSDPIPLGTLTSDGDGAVSGVFSIPAKVAAGTHTIVLLGRGPDESPIELRAAITILDEGDQGGVEDSGSPGGATGGAATAPTPATPAVVLDARPDYTG